MGRRPKKPGAVPRLRARRQKSGIVHYYYDHGGRPRKETPLGSDYGLAIKQWAELEHANRIPSDSAVTFRQVADRYRLEVIPTKGEKTQRVNINELGRLLSFFDDPPVPFEGIRPLHVRQYMDWRKTAKIAANREKALLSHIWNWARNKGYTDLPNPCAGVSRNREQGRDVYIDDELYSKVYNAADQVLRDAMDLAYLTGQRPSDVYAMDERNLQGGVLRVRQSKTRAMVDMTVSGELEVLIAAIMERKRKHSMRSTRLLVDTDGLPVGRDALRYRFDQARLAAGIAKADFQFRDLRAKAGTDKADSSGDMRQAQSQLGHKNITMTEHYVRKRRGARTTPTR
ncbi:tyrosine-type recombinase/integrase [Xanthomonas albilineans]|uniref:tyrosine-type recombinase/integrase n=1 Tax=Xanthomonas albilineans TaxID=29447 RepID=UPI0005F343BB|nr:tyrosine-type recombinase/integrase [Xanthomonas albilineans]